MKNTIFAGTLFALLVFVAGPSTASAYGTSAQKAVRLTESHVLFSITYDLGFLNRGTYAPLMANTNRERNEVRYEIKNESGATIQPRSAGFVTATHSEVKNNFHKLEYGKKSDFTLYVIAEIPQTSDEHYLQITSLPFILVDKDNSTTLSGVVADRLPEYKTPAVQ